MNPYLFVYGSLLKTIAHAMGERLRAEAALVGSATVQGRLYRVSWYPAIIESSADADRVHGEVYRLENPAASLAWLDAYEGLTRDASSVTEPDEYQRVERPARLASNHDIINAWVYLYRHPVTGLGHIASGRWEA